MTSKIKNTPTKLPSFVVIVVIWFSSFFTRLFLHCKKYIIFPFFNSLNFINALKKKQNHIILCYSKVLLQKHYSTTRFSQDSFCHCYEIPGKFQSHEIFSEIIEKWRRTNKFWIKVEFSRGQISFSILPGRREERGSKRLPMPKLPKIENVHFLHFWPRC